MEQIEYTRTIVPKSMRSRFWRYFGFPSDSKNNILTKQKVVCVLCNMALAYNKNTSNLRTHLMSKHIEEFQRLLSSASEENGNESDNRKRRISENEQSTVKYDVLIATDEESDFETVETERIINVDITEPKLDAPDTELSQTENPPTPYNEVHQQPLEYTLADMIQTDLLTLDLIRSQGFRMYNVQVSGAFLEPNSLERVNAILRERIANTQDLINNRVHQLSQKIPFSFTMESYQNSEEMSILNIYFNFLNESQSQLISLLYKSVNVGKSLNLFDILKDLDLKNCYAIVVNDLKNMEDIVFDFAKINGMELVECLASTLTRCLQKIFQLEFVNEKYEEICNYVIENNLLITCPNVRSRCPWSKFNNLAFFCEHIDNKHFLDSDIKLLFDYIRPLKTALDIIGDEQMPICTLNRPLISKLFEQHFDDIKANDNLSQIHSILDEELKKSINNTFLRDATYFDPRFRQDFNWPESPFDLKNLKTKLLHNFKHLLDIGYSNNTEMKDRDNCLLRSSKRSSLKSFFNREDITVKSATTAPKSNVDLEFERYQVLHSVDLDQNPALWWRERSLEFPELNKVVFHYFVPCCCVQYLYTLDMECRRLICNRRKQLSEFCDIERNLWYLHYNSQIIKSEPMKIGVSF